MQPLRSLLFVPGNNPRMLERALSAPADALVFDLEDSVAPDQKASARGIVAAHLAKLGSRKAFVRVNSLQTGMTAADLAAVVGPNLQGVSIGKVDTPHLAEQASTLLSHLERERGLPAGQLTLLPWIESAQAIMDMREIATATPRLLALWFGAEDFTADMGIPRSRSLEEVTVPRALIAVAARAAGILALDTPDPDFKDIEHLAAEARQARALGYSGKFVIHPNQIETVNAVFTPSAEDVAQACRVVAAFEASLKEGKASVALDSQMVDTPVWKRAVRLVELAESIERAQSR